MPGEDTRSAPEGATPRRTWRMRGWAKVELLLDGEHECFVWLDHGENMSPEEPRS